MIFTVGLTGGIGSGKSTVAQLFAEQGVYIIDADVIAHTLSRPPSIALREIAQQFGPAYLTQEGLLNRQKMRELVFQDVTARQKLERIFHPLVHREIRNILQKKDFIAPYVMIAIPLLFESGSYEEMIHRRLVVDCSIEQQIARTMARSHFSRETVEQIIRAQISREERLAHADDIIDNSQGVSQLQTQVLALHRYYLQLHVMK